MIWKAKWRWSPVARAASAAPSRWRWARAARGWWSTSPPTRRRRSTPCRWWSPPGGTAVPAALRRRRRGRGGHRVQGDRRRRGRACTSWSTTPGVAVNALTLGSKDADWRRALDVNLGGTVNCTRAALRALMKARERGPHHQHHLGRGRDGLGRAGALRRGQGRHRRPDQDLGARVRVAGRDRQRGVAGLHRHRHDRGRPAARAAPGHHAGHPAGPGRQARGRGRGGGLPGRPAARPTSPGKSCASTAGC